MMARRFDLARAGAGGRSGDAWRALQFGTLWGLATMAMESLATPLGAVTADRTTFVAALAPLWCLKSILVAYLALRAERRYRGLRLAVLALLTSLLASGVSMMWVTIFFPDNTLYRVRQQPLAVFCFELWAGLFYGGVLLVGCVVLSRAARMRRLLSQAEIDRGLTEALVTEIRFKELQGSVNTEVLYDTLSEVMRRYVAGLPSADRLLDALVGFLRTAMPSLRESTSTLAAELELTRTYMRLRAELHPQRGAWRIEAADDVGALLFPPLQLIDVLDRWMNSPEGQAGGVMAITPCAGGARVELRADVSPEGGGAQAAAPRALSKTFDFLNPAYLPGGG